MAAEKGPSESGTPAGVRSVTKAIAILNLIAAEGGKRATPVATELGIPVPTAFRLLDTLVSEGMLSKDPSRRYHLGPHMGTLANAFLRETAPPGFLLDGLRALSQETGESAYLSAWRHGDVLVLAAVEGTHNVRVAPLQTGYRGDVHARAAGKVFLAELSDEDLTQRLQAMTFRPRTPDTIRTAKALRAELGRVRADGYALDRGEFMVGVTCIAAPVRQAGAVIAALTIAVPTQRFAGQSDELVASVRAAVAAVSP